MKINNYDKVPIITIDGPTGTGKGTLCRKLSERLQWNNLDSGLIYRLLASLVIKNHVDINDHNKIITLIDKIDLKNQLNENSFQEIRTEQCGNMASILAAIPEIRNKLLQKQRDCAVLPGLVTDGRDMGTVVFPDAFLKIYLDASIEERAKRRHKQLQENGIDVSLSEVVQQVGERDLRDINRAHSPLMPASDAVIVNTNNITVEQTVNLVLQLAKQRGMVIK